jgi:Permuted papain-like amidase enzyme, YaeF/YiiX, C92 family
MNREQLTAATQTVIQLADYLEELKAQALSIYHPKVVAQRGYVTPSEELSIRQLQLSYWKARNALFELVFDIWRDIQRIDRATPQQFLVALAAAAVLVDAARFLRETFHRDDVVRRKLDEPDPVYGIPSRLYDDVQKSLTDPYHAWYLWQATRYYDQHHDEFQTAVHNDPTLAPLVAIIDRLRDRLRPSLWMYVRTRLRVRGRRTARHIGRDIVGSGVYSVQEAVGRGMAHVQVRPGHMPNLPPTIRDQLVGLLRPGDVLVVRKEHAATNYFLPGYWPHAALFLGTSNDLVAHGIADHEYVRPRIAQLEAATPTMAVLVPCDATWPAGVPHPCVLESQKDGVKIRSVNSPLASDSVVVVRPLLEQSHIAAAMAQALMHEGKPYDFDFDFSRSHRLVCTGVIYRAYEGVGGVQFDLERHVGRFALAAGDILRMALARRHFEVMYVYSPAHSLALETGPAAEAIVRQVEGAAS